MCGWFNFPTKLKLLEPKSVWKIFWVLPLLSKYHFQPNWNYWSPRVSEKYFEYCYKDIIFQRFNMIFKPNLEFGSPSVSHSFYFSNAQNFRIEINYNFYQTWVQSLATLVTNSMTDWQTNCCLLDLIDVSLACETCCCCYCCWCWWWGSCWQQFVADFEAEVWSKSKTFV